MKEAVAGKGNAIGIDCIGGNVNGRSAETGVGEGTGGVATRASGVNLQSESACGWWVYGTETTTSDTGTETVLGCWE